MPTSPSRRRSCWAPTSPSDRSKRTSGPATSDRITSRSTQTIAPERPGRAPDPEDPYAPAMRIPSSLSLLILVAPVAAQHGWSAPVPIAALNTVGADTGAHISPDGLTMHWASSVSGNWEIYSATRTARGAPWGAPVLETVLSDPTAVDSEPFLSADGLTIYFASQRPGGTGSTDIMRATRPNPTAPWGQPTFVTELNSSGADAAPAVTEDELEIYF